MSIESGPDESMEPKIDKNQKAEWITVDKKLISWAWSIRNSRKNLQKGYSATYGKSRVNFIPCECGCGRNIQEGEQALQISWETPGHAPRIFATVECQRRNYVEAKTDYQAGRQEYNKKD